MSSYFYFYSIKEKNSDVTKKIRQNCSLYRYILECKKNGLCPCKNCRSVFFSSEFLLLCHSIEDYELIHIGSSLKHEYDADAISYLYLYNAWL